MSWKTTRAVYLERGIATKAPMAAAVANSKPRITARPQRRRNALSSDCGVMVGDRAGGRAGGNGGRSMVPFSGTGRWTPLPLLGTFAGTRPELVGPDGSDGFRF